MTEAKVSILDRGFLFADGIYEVSAVLDGKLVDNASHLARLERSVGEIKLALPETVERITELQKELIARNKIESGLVYLQVTRGADKGRDFPFPKGDVKSSLVMFTSEKDIVSSASRSAPSRSPRRSPPRKLSSPRPRRSCSRWSQLTVRKSATASPARWRRGSARSMWSSPRRRRFKTHTPLS